MEGLGPPPGVAMEQAKTVPGPRAKVIVQRTYVGQRSQVAAKGHSWVGVSNL